MHSKFFKFLFTLFRENNDYPVCDVANYLVCGIKVIGGSQKCLDFLENNSSRFDFKVI